MVTHHCSICCYTTIYTTNYNKHLLTKKHLSNVKDKNIQKTENTPKIHPKCTQMHPNAPNNKTCEFCKKSFTRTTGLKKHLKICSMSLNHTNAPKCTPNDPKTTPNDPKTTPNDPKTTPNDPKTTPNDSYPILCSKNEKENEIIIPKKYTCEYCDKEYSKSCHLRRHEKTCKAKLKAESNDKKLLLMEKKIIELEKKNHSLTNNNINNNINTQNNGTINYLNVHFNNVQPLEEFIENLKTKFQLSNSDRKCLLDTYNECGIDSFADTFSIIMKKNLIEQIHNNKLPTMPLVCTDSNLRSIKEYHKDGWKATQSNKSIDQMIDISNEQIYESEQTKVFISQKDRKKVYNKIKKDNTLLSLEKDKKNYNENDNEDNYDNDNDNDITKYDKITDSIEISKDFDFSNIDDDMLEKYAIDKV